MATDALLPWIASDGFMPHGHCYLWTPELLWTYVASDTMIGLAYYSIPLALSYFVRKRRDLRFNWIFVMFSIFIFACGTTHFLALWTIWHPDYWLDAMVKMVTAATSVVTAILLWPLIPKALKLPSTDQLQNVILQLESEIAERRRMEEALRQSEQTLRELAAHQEQIREEERKRIAREIHDELGQNLLALRIDVVMLQERAGDTHPNLKRRAAAALGYIDTTVKSVRTIMNNLRPAVLDLGLQAAIDWQISEFKRTSGIECELVMDDGELALDDAHATAVFRIVQESLTNVRRHSRATRVHVELRLSGNRLCMTVSDNGIGIDVGQRRRANTFGLVGIRERATMLGGEVVIGTAPGGGTVIGLVIPAAAQAVTP